MVRERKCILAILCGGSKPPPCLGDQKKKHKETFLIVFFSLVRKERKGQKEESIPLLNTFCRLATTSTNKVPRPSRYSITTATGSKRSSADSDLLLCHARLWRTSRFRLGCMSGCEHSEMGFALAVPSAHKLYPRPPCTFSGRADNACTNLLGFFVRYVRTRGSMRFRRAAKLSIFAISPLSHALSTHYFLRLTRARRQWFGRRTARVLLADFCRAFRQ